MFLSLIVPAPRLPPHHPRHHGSRRKRCKARNHGLPPLLRQGPASARPESPARMSASAPAERLRTSPPSAWQTPPAPPLPTEVLHAAILRDLGAAAGGSGCCCFGRLAFLPAEADFAILGVQCCYRRRAAFVTNGCRLCYLERVALLLAVLDVAALGVQSCCHLGWRYCWLQARAPLMSLARSSLCRVCNIGIAFFATTF